MASRQDPNKLFNTFLKQHDLVIANRPQKVKYTGENDILIEAPRFVLMYRDDFSKAAKPPTPQPEGKSNIELPPQKDA